MKTGKHFNRTGMLALTLTFGLALAVSGKAQAQAGGAAAPASDFNYDLSRDGKGVVIKKYTGAGGKVVIPAKIEGYAVVAIGGSSFAPASSNGGRVTSVVIPASVKSIGAGAFAYNNNLKSVVIQGTGVGLDNGAFAKCGSLSELVFPNAKNALIPVNNYARDAGAFFECEGLPLAVREKLKAMGFPDTSNSINLDEEGWVIF
jgi:hypothetical protein